MGQLHAPGSPFPAEFKVEVMKITQSTELQKRITSGGKLVIAKHEFNKFAYPLITTIIDQVNSAELERYIAYLNELFRVYDPQRKMTSTLGLTSHHRRARETHTEQVQPQAWR